MQQIPIGTEEVAKIRQAYLDQLPLLVEADFSAMEARIMAQKPKYERCRDQGVPLSGLDAFRSHVEAKHAE